VLAVFAWLRESAHHPSNLSFRSVSCTPFRYDILVNERRNEGEVKEKKRRTDRFVSTPERLRGRAEAQGCNEERTPIDYVSVLFLRDVLFD